MFAALHQLAHKFLPTWIYQRLIGDWDKDGFKKYFTNTSWVAIARIISLIISFLTIAVIARYLGPENYGKLSYVQNFVALFSAFAVLGLDQVLYRDLTAEPEKESELLGTAFILRLFFGVITLFATISVALLINNDPVLVWMTGIIACSFIFQPFGVIGHLFNARVQAKYTSYIAIFISFVIPLLKLATVYLSEGILYFSIFIALESIIYAIGYVYMYRKIFGGVMSKWNFSKTRALHLLRHSWPLLLASFSGYIYGRIDQVMIQQFLDSIAVGFYDVAVRLTELLGFLPGVIISSLFPAIINARRESTTKYRKRFRSLTILCTCIAFASALSLFVLAPLIIHLLFGPGYEAAVSITRLYVWSIVGTILIILMQQYFIAEQRSIYFLVFSLFGAAVNIGLNLILIPQYGVFGAALATILTLATVLLVFILTKNGIVTRNKAVI